MGNSSVATSMKTHFLLLFFVYFCLLLGHRLLVLDLWPGATVMETAQGTSIAPPPTVLLTSFSGSILATTNGSRLVLDREGGYNFLMVNGLGSRQSLLLLPYKKSS